MDVPVTGSLDSHFLSYGPAASSLLHTRPTLPLSLPIRLPLLLNLFRPDLRKFTLLPPVCLCRARPGSVRPGHYTSPQVQHHGKMGAHNSPCHQWKQHLPPQSETSRGLVSSSALHLYYQLQDFIPPFKVFTQGGGVFTPPQSITGCDELTFKTFEVTMTK